MIKSIINSERGNSGGSIGGIVGGVVGAAIGGYFGGPQGAFLGFSIGTTVGSIAGSIIDPVKPKNTRQSPEGIKDFFITSSALGQMIPILKGTYRIPGNIIAADKKQEHIIETQSASQTPPQQKGKGGGTDIQIVEEKVYSISFAIALCKGPVSGVTKIWTDLDLWYDESADLGRLRFIEQDENSITFEGVNSSCDTVILYLGTEEQPIDPTLESIYGVGNVPAYRGTAYLVFKDLDLGNAGRLPNFTFEVSRDRNADSPQDITVGTDGVYAIYKKGLALGSEAKKSSITGFTLGTLVSETMATLGVNGRKVATLNLNGVTTDYIAVVNSGSPDGIDPSTDTLSVFSGGPVLSNYATANLRTGGEISSNATLGSNFIGSDGNLSFFICLETVSGIAWYHITNGLITRATLPTAPIELVCANGFVYVLRATNLVTKLTPTGGSLNITDTISVGAGSAQGHIISGNDDKIWVTNNAANTVSHFKTSGDVGTVAVGPNPIAIAEAADGYIWVSSSTSGTITRIHPTAYTTETFTLPLGTISLAKAVGGEMWASTNVGASGVYLIHTDGTYESIRVPGQPSKILSDSDGFCYVMCVTGKTLLVISPDASASNILSNESSLACVVRDFSQMAGLAPEEIDVSLLDNTPVNMVITEVQSAKDVIETLANTFSFIGIESEGVLKYLFKSNIQNVATIPENALSADIDKPDSRSLALARLQERELPTKFTVTYSSPNRNYQEASQHASLTSGNIELNPQVLRVPLALSDAAAYKIAEVHLYEPWINRERAELSLSSIALLFDPADGITVTSRGVDYDLTFNELNLTHNWLVRVKAVGYETGFYDEIIPTPGIGSGGLNEFIPASRMAVVIVEAPPLSNFELATRFFVASYKLFATRSSVPATLYRSTESAGVNFELIGTSRSEATVGNVATAVNGGNQYNWDNTSVITVDMYNDNTLSTATEDEVLSGANRAMYGNELIQFRTATLISPRVYELRNLLHGRQGSERFIGTHAANEKFVLLNNLTTNNNFGYSSDLVSILRYYKVVDVTTSLAQATSFTQTLNGDSVRAWAPVILPLVRNSPSTNDITINWLYRSKFSGDNPLNAGSPIAWDIDFSKSFFVTIYTDNTFTGIKRLLNSIIFTDPEATLSLVYTEALQIVDFGSAQSTIYYGVKGLGNTIVGFESRASG